MESLLPLVLLVGAFAVAAVVVAVVFRALVGLGGIAVVGYFFSEVTGAAFATVFWVVFAVAGVLWLTGLLD